VPLHTAKGGRITLWTRSSVRHFDAYQYSSPRCGNRSIDPCHMVGEQAGGGFTSICDCAWQLRIHTICETEPSSQRCRATLSVSISGWRSRAVRTDTLDLRNSRARRTPALLAPRMDLSTSRTRLVLHPAPLELLQHSGVGGRLDSSR
jgi:hypothetical protein